jgi:hypothetical protein
MRNFWLGCLLVTGLLGAGLAASWSSPEPPWNGVTNCSGSIVATGVPQVLITSTPPRHGFQLQNLTSTQMSWSDLTSTPSVGGAGSWSLVVSTTPYQTPSTFTAGSTIWIVGTISSTFACEVW